MNLSTYNNIGLVAFFRPALLWFTFSDLTLFAFAVTKNLANNIAHIYFFFYNTTLSHFSLYLQKKVLANKTLKEQMFFIKRNKLMIKTKPISNYIKSLK
jgi:hypothetical protein